MEIKQVIKEGFELGSISAAIGIGGVLSVKCLILLFKKAVYSASAFGLKTMTFLQKPYCISAGIYLASFTLVNLIGEITIEKIKNSRFEPLEKNTRSISVICILLLSFIVTTVSTPFISKHLVKKQLNYFNSGLYTLGFSAISGALDYKSRKG